MVGSYLDRLPDWTADAGGRHAWLHWLENRAETCVRRARTSGPSRADFKLAVLGALHRCEGRGHFSRLPLLLGRKPTHALYPSIDHLEGPASSKLVVETRLFNDLKTILDEQEFRAAIGHLSAVLAVTPERLRDDWSPKRHYGGLP